MRHALFHRDDGIEQYLEVGGSITLRVGGDGRCQMAASREAHDAHLLGIDVPGFCHAAYQSHGLLGILDGYPIGSVWHAVFQYDDGNAHAVEERCPLRAFVLHGQMAVATTRADDDGTPRRLALGRQIDRHLCHILRVAITRLRPLWPQIQLQSLLGSGHQREKCQEKYEIFLHCFSFCRVQRYE